MVVFKHSLNEPQLYTCMVPDKANLFRLKNKRYHQTIVTHCQKYENVEQFNK